MADATAMDESGNAEPVYRPGHSDDDAVLAERARLLARPIETAARDDVATQLLGLDAGDGRFALPMGSVTTVLAPVRPTPIPGQPAWLAGAMGLRGRVIAVIEPDRFLGVPSGLGQPAERLTVAVVSAGDREVALLVDRIGRIEEAESAELKLLPVGTAELVTGAVLGTVGGRHLLDVEGLVAAVGHALRPQAGDPGPREHRRSSPR